MQLFPSDYIPDPNSGRPLANAYIYVGTAGTDPTQPGNQIQLTSRQSDGSAVNLAQPVRTNSGGVPIQADGTAAIVQLPANTTTFAIRINNVNNVQQYLFSDVPVTGATTGIPQFAISTNNFNTLTESGFYTGTGSTPGAPDDVPDVNLVNCVHVQRSTGNSTQMFFVIDPATPNLIYNSVYFRTQNSTVFGTHVRLLGSNFLSDATDSTSSTTAASSAAVNTVNNRITELAPDNRFIYFNASGTWNVPRDGTVRVIVIGGGGAGSAGVANLGSGDDGGGGGGGGGASFHQFDVTQGNNYTVTVGASGGTSSFTGTGVNLQANGGGAGSDLTGGTGGTASGGNINNVTGGSGGNGGSGGANIDENAGHGGGGGIGGFQNGAIGSSNDGFNGGDGSDGLSSDGGFSGGGAGVGGSGAGGGGGGAFGPSSSSSGGPDFLGRTMDIGASYVTQITPPNPLLLWGGGGGGGGVAVAETYEKTGDGGPGGGGGGANRLAGNYGGNGGFGGGGGGGRHGLNRGGFGGVGGGAGGGTDPNVLGSAPTPGGPGIVIVEYLI